MTPTNQALLSTVLAESWQARGGLVYAGGKIVADTTAVERGEGGLALESARARVAASAPTGVQLARLLGELRHELEDEENLDGAWLTEAQWQRLQKLAADVLATAEGSR